MSYIRAGWPMQYVDGNSTDYVFLSSAEGKKDWVEDYGRLSNEGLVEIFAGRFKPKDKKLHKYMLQMLAKKLQVKLREKPLTIEQVFHGMEQNIKDDKRCQKLLKSLETNK